jgi:hypothetical protein
MANTYTLISSVNVGSGGTTDITFNSIPSTYTDLCLQLSMRNSRGASLVQEGLITFNGTTSGYSEKIARGDGSVTISTSGSGANFYLNGFPAGGVTSSVFGNATLYIPNYTGSSNKSISGEFVTENNSTTAYLYLNAMYWSNTSAITSINIAAGSTYTWLQHSTASLYGISKS